MSLTIKLMLKKVLTNMVMAFFGERMIESCIFWGLETLVSWTKTDADDKKLAEFKDEFYAYKERRKAQNG